MKDYNEKKSKILEKYDTKIKCISIPAYSFVFIAILGFFIYSFKNNLKNNTPDYFKTFQTDILERQDKNYYDFLVYRDSTIILKNEIIKEQNEKYLILKNYVDSLEKVKNTK